MSVVRVARQADNDLDDISDDLAAKNVSAAVRVLDSLQTTFLFLADNPFAGTVRPDLRDDLRVFPGRPPAHNYIVFYSALDNGIEVMAVLHASRDYITMFQQGER